MIKVGLTGGIGTGKSLVADIFRALEVPVYHADTEAGKFLYNDQIIHALVARFGDTILAEDGTIRRKFLAEKVFSNPADLSYLNNLIHPLVREDFKTWSEQWHDHRYIIQEAAILFESGFNRLFDKIILVTAPSDICISRVMNRDKVTEKEVHNRMSHQWAQDKKLPLADFVIQNDGDTPILPQVLKIHELLMNS